MDYTGTFINMCIKATEIQERWQHVPGDFFTTINGEVAVLSKWSSLMPLEYQVVNNEHETDRGVPYTWLPRQDQIQGMLYEIWDESISFMEKQNNLIDFFDAYGINGTKSQRDFKTMEQAWIALLMKEQYNKLWNGEDWEEPE